MSSTKNQKYVIASRGRNLRQSLAEFLRKRRVSLCLSFFLDNYTLENPCLVRVSAPSFCTNDLPRNARAIREMPGFDTSTVRPLGIQHRSRRTQRFRRWTDSKRFHRAEKNDNLQVYIARNISLEPVFACCFSLVLVLLLSFPRLLFPM